MSQDAKLFTKVAVGVTAVILVLIVLFAVGCPQYKVYSREKAGEAALAEARNSKLVQLEEARANLESEKLNALAEVERAKGAARAIEIESGRLTPEYIKYLWVRSNRFDQATTIYVPTEAGLPVLEAGKRP